MKPSVTQIKKKATSTTNKIHKQLNNAGAKLKKQMEQVEPEMPHISPQGHKMDDSVITNNLTSVFTYGDAYMKMSETIGGQIFNSINALVAENLELSKDIFKCTTISDMLKLQEKIFKTNYNALTHNMSNIISNMMDCNGQLGKTYTGDKEHKMFGGMCS